MRGRITRAAAALAVVATIHAPCAAAQDRAVRRREVKPSQPSDEAADTRYHIILPPEFDPANKLTPVVFALHGYGSHMDDMVAVWSEACAQVGAILVAANGSKITDTGGRAWAGPNDAGAVLAEARKDLQKRYKLSRFSPRVLTGMSQGGWAAYSLADQLPRTYRRLIPVAGVYRARSDKMLKEWTEKETADLKRWRVYMMVGVQDKNELVANNRWLAGRLEGIGAAVKAPFANRADPSWGMYQELGHAFPGDSAEALTKELVRALTFVLQPDDVDRENWGKVHADWRNRARWMRDAPGDHAPARPPAEESGATSKPDR